MEEQVNRLVEKIWGKLQSTPPRERILIAVSGIPGSGKTTLAAKVTKGLNALKSSHFGKMAMPPIAGFVPMDGYHLTRAQLSAMPDPEKAHARRGAAFTFNGEAYLSLIQRVRQPITNTSKILYAPSFDHIIKDPCEDDIPIEPSTRVLIFEGLYLSLNKELWCSAAKLMDELWFVEVGFDIALRRLVPRHVKSGLAKDEKDAEKRARENDLVNGEEIVKDRLEVDEVIVSEEDQRWTPEAIGVGQ